LYRKLESASRSPEELSEASNNPGSGEEEKTERAAGLMLACAYDSPCTGKPKSSRRSPEEAPEPGKGKRLGL